MATITTGGAAQDALAANLQRVGYEVQNQSGGSLWISDIATAVAAQPSWELVPGERYWTPDTYRPKGALSIIGATTGQAFAVREW